MNRHRTNRGRGAQQIVTLLLLLALVASACGGDGDGDDAAEQPGAEPAAVAGDESDADGDAEASAVDAEADAEPTATPEPEPTATAEPEPTQTPEPEPTPTPEPEPIRILVTNDDGVGSEGLDLVVQALATLENVELTVVAPAVNQSASSDTVTDPAPTTAFETTTASGHPAFAVEGTPADTVNVALATLFETPPDFIVSGSNDAQNIGPLVSISGTVGAIRTGARQGVPGLAVSQGGVTVEAEHETGIPFMIAWLEENLADAAAFDGDLAPGWSLNTPSCGGVGAVRGVVEDIPIASEFDEGESVFSPDCESTLEDVDDDATGFLNGFATITSIPEELLTNEPEVRAAG